MVFYKLCSAWASVTVLTTENSCLNKLVVVKTGSHAFPIDLKHIRKLRTVEDELPTVNPSAGLPPPYTMPPPPSYSGSSWEVPCFFSGLKDMISIGEKERNIT
ncbi:hypothetical protein NECAME_16016 [Necator americanus]|uniref:Uncharacterized protein n=1 Tax=Necator americanus TaxID=51031 RepID=W2TZ77_NECAM|nr:hypothetical protein NECAME_16016 [Necator americanus]ETN86979.1 hypothetical protein NECAME_16016 [Necator americanus]